MKNKKHYYLVTFLHKQGDGSARLGLDYKIKTFTDIEKVQNTIMEENNIKDVFITNFIKMKGI